MEKTALFGLPFPGEKDKPDGPTQITEAVKSVENLLAILEFLLGTPKAPAAPAPGQLIIVSGTNDPVYKTVTGDVAINSGGVTTIGEGKVTTAKIAELAVTANRIADKAVLTAKLADLNVTTVKLAELAVTTAKIADQAVTGAKIANATITGAKIAASAVTNALIADGAVTSRKFSPTMDVVAMGSINPLANFYQTAGVAEFNAAVGSRVLVWGKFSTDLVGSGTNFDGTIRVDGGAEQGGSAFAYLSSGGGEPVGGFVISAFGIWEINVAAGNHKIEMRAKVSSGSGLLRGNESQLGYLVVN